MNRLLMVVALVIPLFLMPLVFGSSCPTGAKPWPPMGIPNCYTFHTDTLTFISAEISCNNENGHLTSVHDGFTNTFLSQLGNNTFGGGLIVDFWDGASNLAGDNWSWTDGSPWDYTNWRDNPNKKPTKDGQSCGSIALSDGLWNADNCYKQKPYACKVPNSNEAPVTTTTKATPPPPTIATTTTTTRRHITTTTKATTAQVAATTRIPGNCSSGWRYSNITRACYLLTPAFDWNSAEQYCVNLNAHLTSIHSSDELNFFNSLENNWKWTGMFSTDATLTWKYTDNSTVDYAPWANGMPQGFMNPCVHALSVFHNDLNCTTEFKGVCKMFP